MVNVVDDSETSTIPVSIPCDQYTNQSDCEAAGCYWCDGACQQTPCGIVCSDYTTQTDCEAVGCYWCDGACQSQPCGVVCSDYTTQTECEAAGCYWCDGACQQTPCPDECESITTETECISAGCHWYAYPPFSEPSCHSKEMLMAYLPFIIVGVGGAIILVALLTPSKERIARKI